VLLVDVVDLVGSKSIVMEEISDVVSKVSIYVIVSTGTGAIF